MNKNYRDINLHKYCVLLGSIVFVKFFFYCVCSKGNSYLQFFTESNSTGILIMGDHLVACQNNSNAGISGTRFPS